MTSEAELTFRTEVRPEWTDYNGHMNGAFHPLVFDRATDVLLDTVDLGEAYSKRSKCGTFALEAHIIYKREALLNDPLKVTIQVIGFNEKTIHYFHRLFRGDTGELLATFEQISLHVSHETRSAVPMPARAIERLDNLLRAHSKYGVPEGLGSVIAVRRTGPTKVTLARQTE